MKDSELLRKAKRMMELSPANHVDGVCAFIELAAGTICSDQVRRIRRWIYTMLGGRAWLHYWLVENGHMKDSELVRLTEGGASGGELQVKLKATRLAWLDWMIEQCELEESKTP